MNTVPFENMYLEAQVWFTALYLMIGVAAGNLISMLWKDQFFLGLFVAILAFLANLRLRKMQTRLEEIGQPS